MTLSRWRSIILTLAALLTALLLFAACGDSTPQVQTKPTPTPSPTSGPGQRILDTMAQKLNSANTLHGTFDLNITGKTFNGTLNSEIWNATPNKNRTVVLKSSIPQFATGTVTVTNGKQRWQYDPQKNVVYTGPVTADATGTPGASTPTGVGGGQTGQAGNQNNFLLNLVQTVFTSSDATLKSSSTTVNGRSVDDVHVVPQASGTSAGGTTFDYTGEVYIDKTTQLPVEVNLNIQGVGNVVLDIPSLALNAPLPDSTFNFVPPARTKVLPFTVLSETPSSGTISLAQAQQQAGYHLLSIPASQTDYVLNGVNALGSPGNQTYTLNYLKGNVPITLAEGKPLANLPASGQQVNVRGTTGTLSNVGGSTTLAWTEKGIGIRITANLSNNQILNIANLLS